MKKLSITFILLTLISCGKIKTESSGKIDIPNTEHKIETNVTIDIGLEKMAKFCEDRYGEAINESTDELKSEECFQDALKFTQINIKLDNQIPDYCESQFDTPEEIIACEEELLLLMK